MDEGVRVHKKHLNYEENEKKSLLPLRRGVERFW